MRRQSLVLQVLFLAVCLLLSNEAFSQQTKAAPQKKTAPHVKKVVAAKSRHEVTLEEARAMVKRHRQTLKDSSVVYAGRFDRDIFDKILAQKGCKGIRIYHAIDANGKPTFVLVGTDAAGNDLKASTVGETIYPCPPICGNNGELQK